MPPRPAEPPLNRPLHEPLRPALNYDEMSDEQILRMMQHETDSDKYAVKHLEPDGVSYQWVRCEVFGRPDFNRPAEMEQRGWRSVPATRHPGLFMPPMHDGPIEVDGLRLMEMPHRLVRLKRELASRQAAEKVDAMNQQMTFAPPGTAPRQSHPKMGSDAPAVRRESGTLDLVVE